MEPIWQAIQSAWNGVLDLTAKLVTPDWGAVVAMLPVLLAVAVIVFFVWLAVRYANAGPRRRGPARSEPRPPSGSHMPGPSFAPFFAAVGTFLFFFGLVLGAGSLAFWLGLVALVLSLVYWLREGMRDYDAIEHPARPLPAVVEGGPPPGVHMPAPSFRPLLASTAVAVVFLGLILGPAILVAGLIMLIVSLLGWLGDAGTEYHAVAESDESGHLAHQPAPRYPIGTLATFVAVLAVALSITAGVIPPTSGEAGPGGSPAPGASAAPGGSGAAGGASPGASASAPAPAADITITAHDIAYDVTAITAPADRPFTIAFVNNDAGVPHNVAIHKDSPTGAEVWKGDIFNGVATRIYQVPALPAGTYGFACSVHPNMTGTLTVK